MKKLLIAFSLLISTLVNAQNFNVPDPNFEQYLIDVGVDSTSPLNELDGQVNLSIAVTGRKVLDIVNKNISDLTGIERFQSLRELKCSLNNLTSIDLSSNTDLEILLMNGNQLINLDLRAQSKLETLWCQDNNLTSLLLPINSSLNDLQCPVNELTELDLSTSTVLTRFLANTNNFTSLDFNDCINIKDIDVNFCPNFNSISLENCTKLEQVGLRECAFTELNFMNNNALKSVDVQFNDLVSLNLKNIQLLLFGSFIFLNGNPNLTCIEVSDPKFSNANWIKDPQAVFSENCTPNTVSIPDPNFEQALINQNIDSDSIINGQVSESDIIAIEFLDVSANNISDLTGIEGFLALETLFASGNNLTNLDISQNINLSGLYVVENTLESIDVSNNVVLMALALGSNQLISIDLTNNILLSQLFLQNNELTLIDLSSQDVLAELNLSGNNLNELDLSQNSALTDIDCSDNDLFNLNVKNGNNTAIVESSFNASLNENLNCIQVDAIAYSDTNWTNIDSQSFFDLDCAPGNDDCIEATSLDLGTLINGTTFGSTSSNSSPSCQEDDIVLFDVWYQFIAPASGLVTAVATSVLNSLPINMAIYEDCNAVEPISCDSGTIAVTDLIPGNTYFIQIWVGGNVQGRSVLNQIDEFTLIVEDTATLSTTDLEPLVSAIKLMPNPASHQTLITSNSEDINSLQVFDITGKMVLELSQINKRHQRVDTSDLSKGMYLIVLKLENTTTLTKKLLIK